MEPLVSDVAAPEDSEELDDELAKLPPPPRADKVWTLLLLLASGLGALLLAFALRHEVKFALGDGAPQMKGELGTQTLEPGTYVELDTSMAATGAVRMNRPLSDGSERIIPAFGRRDVWLVVRATNMSESGRYVPPSHIAGHVVRADAPGIRFRGTADAVRVALGGALPPNAVFVVDGETPQTVRWALLVTIACIAFALWNAFTAFTLVRKVDANA